MQAHIYVVTHKESGKQYVGQTTVASNKRGHGKLITSAYKKHGTLIFTYEKICSKITNRNTLNYLEKFWISVCNTISPTGYNLEEGGSDKGEVSQQTKEKLRKFNVGKIIPTEVKKKISNSLKGDKNPFFGKTHSPEAIAKIIAANVGKKVIITQETKEKIRLTKIGSKNPMYGKPITDEHRAKLKANTARNRFWLGKKFTDEQKAHLSKVYTCTYCGKNGKGNAMLRHHFDNCKEKTK